MGKDFWDAALEEVIDLSSDEGWDMPSKEKFKMPVSPNDRFTIYPPTGHPPYKALYNAYLGSSNWAGKRRTILDRDNHKCRFCDEREGLHIHHLTYKRVFAERAEDLLTLCDSCHGKAHAYGLVLVIVKNGRKAELEAFHPWVPGRDYQPGQEPSGEPTAKFANSIVALSQASTFSEAIREWAIIKVEKGRTKCPCGMSIKKLVFVENEANGSTTKIGTDCAKHFFRRSK